MKINMIPVEKVLPFIGVSSLDSDFQKLLDEYYVFNLPEKIYDEDGYLDYEMTLFSMDYLSERNSTVFKYNFENQYKLLHKLEHPIAGDFVFEELYVFPKCPGFIGYQGVLPFNIDFNMTSEEISEKLGNPFAVRELKEGLILESFYIAGFIVNVNYEDNIINVISFKRPDFYDLIF